MKNIIKKGFTLIELLAVIAILATVLLISVPKITNVIENVKQKNYDNQVLMIKGSVEKYLSSDTEMIPKNTGDSINVTLQDLVNNGIFKTVPLDPRSGEALPSDSYVTVTRSENGLVYEYLTAEEPVEPAGGTWTFEVTIPAGGDTFSFGVADADLTINWGDETETTHNYVGDDYISHAYTEGVYDVILNGTTSHITFCNFLPETCVATNNYVTAIKTTIPLELGLTDASYMFKEVEGITLFAPDFFNTASANIISMKSMFESNGVFNQDITGWDTSSVTDMSYMFYGGTLFNQDISGWDTSSVTDVFKMFMYAKAFNQPIGSWNTSSVTNMSYMLYDTDSFNQPIGLWNTSSVTDMSSMFRNAAIFNQDISGWDTSNVTNMYQMFRSADGFNQPIGSWNTTNVTDMTGMFMYSKAFNQDISGWNTSSVTNMSYMFAYNDVYNQDINSWNTSSVTNMSNMFYSADGFNQPIGLWDTAKVTDMSYMFKYNDIFDQDITGWDTSSVTNMDGMFHSDDAFNQDLSSWCVSNISALPTDFDSGTTSWVLPKPIWGTCP